MTRLVRSAIELVAGFLLCAVFIVGVALLVRAFIAIGFMVSL